MSTIPRFPLDVPEGFTKISSIVYLHPSSLQPTPITSTRVLIICSWLAAPPKLINYYTSRYISLFPSTTIILVTLPVSIIFSLNRSEELRPAIDILLTLTEEDRTQIGGVIYSNGGGVTMVKLAESYHNQIGRPLPLQTLILDSSPGDSDLRTRIEGFTPAFPRFILSSKPLFFLVNALLWTFVLLLRLKDIVTSQEDWQRHMANSLNDPRLFESVGTKRWYIYSKEDKPVPWRAVENHAREGEGRGWETRLEMFEGSGHVEHAKVDQRRYWSVILGAFGSMDEVRLRSRL